MNKPKKIKQYAIWLVHEHGEYGLKLSLIGLIYATNKPKAYVLEVPQAEVFLK